MKINQGVRVEYSFNENNEKGRKKPAGAETAIAIASPLAKPFRKAPLQSPVAKRVRQGSSCSGA